MRVLEPRSRRRLAWCGVGCALALQLALGAVSPVAGAQPTTSISVEVLSNRADLISGGDALVEIVLSPGVDPLGVRVDVDGRDVTNSFATRPNGRFEGLVTGLKIGRNVVTARNRAAGARITITNHAIGGPVFSGPQVQPWYCSAGAVDAQCNRPITYTYQYKSSVTGSFAAYDPANPPADVATTTTDQGRTVPYIVRVEAGDIDRSQYLIAVLDDGVTPFTRWTGPPAWNHKLYVTHGGGCAGMHTEGAAPSVIDDQSLSHGFAVMSTALEDSNQDCNVVVQAESVMMTKEHLIEAYGDIRYTLGMGSSGGSLAALQMANAYPGLYDGLTVGATFPDGLLPDLLDCPTVLRYFDDPRKWAPGVAWTEAAEAAASGKQSMSPCLLEAAPGGPEDYSNMYNPSDSQWCNMQSTEPARVYNATTNPRGVRCSIQDYMINVLGSRSPEFWGPVERSIGQGFANRAYDNVGVLYGLRALQAGSISPAQFVDLNAKVGAVDIDYGTQPQRVQAEQDGIINAYRAGVLDDATNLDLIPIIDIPNPGDNYDIHDKWKSWALRARLDAVHGNHDNHVIWYGPDSRGMAANAGDGTAFALMDSWLTAIENDHRAVPRQQKVRDDKPSAAHDRCDLPNPAVCNTLLSPDGASVRWGAGGGIATDVIKCRLKPLARSDYAPTVFSDDQWSQLKTAFPTGVCDWTAAGVGQQQHTVAWQTYATGSGGRPLASPPRSTAMQASTTEVRVTGPTGESASAMALGIPDTAADEGGGLLVTAFAACWLGTVASAGRRRRQGRPEGAPRDAAVQPTMGPMSSSDGWR